MFLYLKLIFHPMRSRSSIDTHDQPVGEPLAEHHASTRDASVLAKRLCQRGAQLWERRPGKTIIRVRP